MRNLFTLACLLALAPLATAQQGARFGLGVGLGGGATQVYVPGETFITTPMSIYLPITFSSFRLEPELGLYRISASNDDVDAEMKATAIQLGTGLFAMRPLDASTSFYFGGRVGATFLSEEESFGGSDDDASSTNMFIGPAIGGEHLFGDHFSLGGEAQLMFTSVGSSDEDDETSVSVLNTGAVFFIRWHF